MEDFPHGGACNYQASSRKACGQPLVRASQLEVLGRILVSSWRERRVVNLLFELPRWKFWVEFGFPSGEDCFLMEKMQVVAKFVSSWRKCKPVSSWRSL